MASNYKRLGNYIQQVDVRNTDLSVELLLGVSIEKKFIESHANTVGTDFSKYKIVKRGQFAYGPVTSRNGDKISIALLDEADACLISSSYTPFEIVKPDELNAEYLMMLFRNPEYDRFARYNSWGSAREVFSWEDFCDSELYIPDIEEQQKIVRQYKMITDRICMLEKINENLDALGQALLHSFVNNYECEMISLGNIANIIDCLHSEKPKEQTDGPQLLQLENIKDNGVLDLTYIFHISEVDYKNWTRKREIVEGDCVITNVGRVGAVSQAPRGTHAAMGRNMTCVTMKDGLSFPSYLITVMRSSFIKSEIEDKKDEGTIMNALNVKNIPNLIVPYFSDENMEQLEIKLRPIRKCIENNLFEIQNLNRVRDILNDRR